MSKLTFKLMIVTLCLAVTVVGCKKEEEEPEPTPTNTGGGGGGGEPYTKEFTFKKGADAKDFTKNTTISFANNKITISANDGAKLFPKESMQIVLPDTMRQVKYNLALVPGVFIKINYSIDLNSNTTERYSADGGSFTIDSINVAEKYIKGRFNFTGFLAGGSSVSVSNGKIELKE